MKIANLALVFLAGSALSACNINGSYNEFDGVPLAELELGTMAPLNVTLNGADEVVIMRGTDFTVNVDGEQDAVEELRFRIEDDTLKIGRTGSSWTGGDTATVTITMPSASKLAVSGSGRITSQVLASNAAISISGSGRISTPRIDVDTLKVGISGSGEYEADGEAENLSVAISGSGDADMESLQVETGKISISGSGDVSFASNGRVSAGISGSGDVRVTGDAECEERSSGSGELICG